MEPPLIRRKTPQGMKVFNADTGRWVLENRKKGKIIMNQAGATFYGNENNNQGAVYIKGRQHDDNRWVSQIYYRPNEEPTTVVKLANTLFKAKENKEGFYAVLKYLDDEGRSIPFSVRPGNFPNAIALANYLAATVEAHNIPGVGGSDIVGELFDIYTPKFKVFYRSPKQGGNPSNKSTILKTKYFKTRSFKCDNDDCLLAILRCDKTSFSNIRKIIKLPKGQIGINYIPMIEEYFQKNINILQDSIEIKKQCIDTEDKNRTKVEISYSSLYLSDGKYDETIDILLKDNHYSLIIRQYPIECDPVCGDELQRSKKNKPLIMNETQRYRSLIRQGRKVAGFKEVDQYIDKYIFFDIETIFDFDSDNELQPYSIAWFECRQDLKIMFNKKNINKYLEKTNIVTGDDCMEKFVDWIEENDIDEMGRPIRYTLIGFNNSRFDNFPLLKQTIESDIFTNVLFVQNSILKMVFCRRHVVFDLCRFVSSSLKAACDSFKVYPKKLDGFSHFLPQDAFDEGYWDGLYQWIDDNIVLLTKYNKYDVLATANLFYVVRASYYKITKADILDYTTLAGLSYDNFLKSIIYYGESFVKNGQIRRKREYKFDIRAPDLEWVDKIIRSATIGGHCEKFKKNFDIFETIRCVDVKSLYPFIMLNFYFPIGDFTFTKIYNPHKLGIYRVVIKKQPDKKIIPKRDDNGLNWQYDGKFEAVLTSVDIECIFRHGGKVEFIPLNDDVDCIGFYWEESSKEIFKNYFEPIKNEKTKQDILKKEIDDSKKIGEEITNDYNPALRNISKLLLNSLSGKTIQRNFDTTVEMVKNDKEHKHFENKVKNNTVEIKMMRNEYYLLYGELKEDRVYNKNKAKPSYLGVFIYAHARAYMYDLIYSNYDVTYTDTDSAIIRNYDFNNFKNKFIQKKDAGAHEFYCLSDKRGIPTMGGEFGQFEEELDSTNKKFESYILAKKMYAVEMKLVDGNICPLSKYRLKGINLSKDILISKEQHDEIKNLEPSIETNKKLYSMFKTYLDSNKTSKIEPFKRLYDDRECFFFCSRLCKKNLEITQSFNVKHIKVTDDVQKTIKF